MPQSQPARFDREEPVSNHGEERSQEVSHVGYAAKGEEERRGEEKGGDSSAVRQ